MEDSFRIADIVRRFGRERPDATVLEFRGSPTSWHELDVRSNQTANGLRSLGVGPRDRVAIFDKNSSVYFDVLFGACKLNAITVGVNWRLAAAEIATILRTADCKVVFVSDAYAETLTKAIKLAGISPSVVPIGDPGAPTPNTTPFDQWLLMQESSDPAEAPEDDDVVLLVFTSGTTGIPKGAMLTNRGFGVAIPALASIWGYDDSCLNLMAMPLFHSSISWVLTAMHAGVPTIVTREANAGELAGLLCERKITHTFLVPAVVDQICELLHGRNCDLSMMRVLLYGSAPITTEALKRGLAVFGPCLTQCYGLTEALTGLTQLDPEDHVVDGPRSRLLRSCGKPYAHIELRVVDPAKGVDVATGETGEVWARSDQFMLGYWRQPEATAATITSDGWLRTGDAGHVDDEGYVYLTDRLKDVINSGGENIYPVEIEDVLATHPAVQDVSVVGVPDERWGEAVKGFVVLRAGSDVSERELIEFTRDRLAHYKCPKSLAFIDELPRNPSGKVLKRVLREPYWEQQDRRV